MRALWKSIGLLSAGMLVFAAVQATAAAGDAASGATLYTASCAKCHQDKPGKMMGKPVNDLLAKFNKYKNTPSATGKVAEMQKAFLPWSEKDMNDVATYLNGLK